MRAKRLKLSHAATARYAADLERQSIAGCAAGVKSLYNPMLQ